eukprot:713070_1
MGTAQTVPNAEEQVGTTLFQVDFVVWTITAAAKTILFLIWFFHAYFNVNLIPIRNEITKVLQTQPKTRTIEILTPNGSRTGNCSSPENMSASRSPGPPVPSVTTDIGTVSTGDSWKQRWCAIDGKTMRLFYSETITAMVQFESCLIESQI